MQKKIIALAIAAAFSAPAFADTSNVTVYGKVDVSYDIIDTGSSVGVAGAKNNSVSSNTSLVGLKGSEDLGDGLSAVWQVETLLNIGSGGTNNGNAGLGSRNTFVGLSSGSYGTAVLGRHDTPYKIATRSYDVFGDGIADNRSIMGGVSGKTAGAAFDGRQDQVVAYISPKLGNVATIAIGHVNLSPTNVTAAQGKNRAWSMAGMFDFGAGFSGSLAHEIHDLYAIAIGTKEKATKLGLSYAQEAFAVNLAYEKTNDNLGAAGANALGHNAYYLSGKFNVNSNDTVKAAYTNAGANAVAGTDAKQFSLGYDHKLGKRTTVYALYTKLTNGTAGVVGLSSNSSIAPANNGAGAAPSAFAFGLKQTF